MKLLFELHLEIKDDSDVKWGSNSLIFQLMLLKNELRIKLAIFILKTGFSAITTMWTPATFFILSQQFCEDSWFVQGVTTLQLTFVLFLTFTSCFFVYLPFHVHWSVRQSIHRYLIFLLWYHTLLSLRIKTGLFYLLWFVWRHLSQ